MLEYVSFFIIKINILIKTIELIQRMKHHREWYKYFNSF